MRNTLRLAVALITVVLSLALRPLAAQTRPTTQASGPVASYPLAGDGREATGLAKDARVAGAAPALDRFGRKDRALAFDGVDDEVVLDPPPKLSSQGFTVAVWVKPSLPEKARVRIDVTDGNGKFCDPIVGQDDGYTIRTFQLVLNPERKVIWHRLGEYSSAWTKNAVVEEDKWMHVAATFDGKYHRLFVNGKEEHKVEGILKLCHCDPIYVGSKGAGTMKRAFFRGAMSDLRFYDRAVSADEIAAMHGEKQ